MKNSFVKQVAILALVMGAFASFADPAIDRIVVRQQWPWSTDVCVDYRLTGVTTPVDVAVAASDNGRELDLTSRVSGNQFALAESGTYRLFIKTDGLFETGRTVTDKFKVKLTTTDSDPSVASALYKIVDLESGVIEDVSIAKLLSGSYEGVDVGGQDLVPGGAVDVNRVRWCGVTNDVQYATSKLVLRRIKAAGQSFMMGTNINEMGSVRTQWNYASYGTVGDETRHEVSFSKDYYIGVFEITQSQYNKITTKWPSQFANPSYRDVRPVERVSYADVTEDFLPMLNAKASKTFALPTEAQWEFACRAGTTTGLNSGKDIQWAYRTGSAGDPYVMEVARCKFNAYPVDYGAGYENNGTARVGTYQGNAWGLYDMHGNVGEWCRDWLKIDLGADPDQDPETLSQTEAGAYRVVRNTGWEYMAGNGCMNGSKRSAFRWGKAPSDSQNTVGFRLMLPVD